jgi:hypothetical protein
LGGQRQARRNDEKVLQEWLAAAEGDTCCEGASESDHSRLREQLEHGRHLRLDDEAERKLLEGAQACAWRRQTFELFRDIVILLRDTGMGNQRELYGMRMFLELTHGTDGLAP